MTNATKQRSDLCIELQLPLSSKKCLQIWTTSKLAAESATWYFSFHLAHSFRFVRPISAFFCFAFAFDCALVTKPLRFVVVFDFKSIFIERHSLSNTIMIRMPMHKLLPCKLSHNALGEPRRLDHLHTIDEKWYFMLSSLTFFCLYLTVFLYIFIQLIS